VVVAVDFAVEQDDVMWREMGCLLGGNLGTAWRSGVEIK